MNSGNLHDLRSEEQHPAWADVRNEPGLRGDWDTHGLPAAPPQSPWEPSAFSSRKYSLPGMLGVRLQESGLAGKGIVSRLASRCVDCDDLFVKLSGNIHHDELRVYPAVFLLESIPWK